MKVKYIYSACLEIECGGFRILTDPWFTDGAYDGSWFQYPKIDPFKHIQKKPDIIYISHIHPDHYDPTFLHQIQNRFGPIEIIIPDLKINSLQKKGSVDGLNLTPVRHYENNDVELFIEENDTGSISDIDSALIVKDKHSGQVLLNLNDCIFNQTHADKLKNILSSLSNSLDVLALGYTGAGPFPQTYFSIEDQLDLLEESAKKKKLDFFKRYMKYSNFFNAKINLPFAGEYVLGGKLYKLNKYRGVADAIEIKDFDQKAVILNPGGFLNLDQSKIINERQKKHSQSDIENYLEEIKTMRMAYEDIKVTFDKLLFKKLLEEAAVNAEIKSEMSSKYNFIFELVNESDEIILRLVLKTNPQEVFSIQSGADISFTNYSAIKIDYRYFYGLLTSKYHWNNAIVGSQFFTKREPIHDFRRDVQSYLYYLTTKRKHHANQ